MPSCSFVSFVVQALVLVRVHPR